MSNFYNVLGICFWVLVCSCARKKPEVVKPEINFGSNKVFILNEGLFNQNNSSITFKEEGDKIAEQHVFRRVNGRGLGDTGNDIAIYGQKIYVLVSGSSQLEVVNASNCQSVKQVPLFYEGVPMQPRNLAFWQNYLFISCFDGHVVVMDTISCTPLKYLVAGRNPEGIAVSNNKLFVSNSGGLDFPNYDNSVSVFDLHGFTKVATLTVGENPGGLEADGNGNVFVIVRKNPESEKSLIKIINADLVEVTDSILINSSGIKIKGDSLLIKDYSYVKNTSSVKLYSISGQTLVNSAFIKGSDFQVLYGLNVDIRSGEIYCSDARDFVSNGKVRVYDFSGNFKYEFEAGVNPGHITFYYTP